jgi:phosphoribosylanthranilate isomerase
LDGIVKVCGITSERDLELAEDAGADYVGFVVDPGSARCVPLGRALELGARCLSAQPVLVARSLDARGAPEAFVRQALRHEHVAPGAAHWHVAHGDEGVPEWASAVLLDSAGPGGLGGTGRRLDPALAARLVAGWAKPAILAGGLGPDNVAEAIEAVRPAGVDACSGTEARPGVKDPARLRDYVQAARTAFGRELPGGQVR